MSKRTILFDGDVAAYQFGFAAERPVEWPGGLWTMHADANMAQFTLNDMLETLMDELKGDRLVVVLSDDDEDRQFRYKLAADYKANRKGKRKPMLHPKLREFMKLNYDVYQRPTLEGDDTLGILLTSPTIIKGEKICVSIDKDMKTVPGLHYNTNKKDAGIVEVTEDEADYFHMLQTLTGDTVDNYKGCPGVGPVAAERILVDAVAGGVGHDERFEFDALDNEYAWEQVVAAYEKKGLGEEEALRQARLARILRAEDYDFEKKKVILWTP